MAKNDFKNLLPLEAIHQIASGLYDSGIIDGKTMRQYDELCLPPVNSKAEMVTPTLAYELGLFS